MKDEIAVRRQEFEVTAKGLAHAALDAVAFVRFANDLAHGQPHARARHCRRLRGQEPGDGWRLPLAACRVSALIISMLAQTNAGERMRSRRVIC